MIEYERKFAISEREAFKFIELDSSGEGITPYIAQDDLFPFGVFKNGLMFRIRLEVDYPNFKSNKGIVTMKWWDNQKRRVEHELNIGADLAYFLLETVFSKSRLQMSKARIVVEPGVFLDYVRELGWFIEMEEVVPPSSVATLEQREEIDREFKSRFKRLIGKDGEFDDFSYSGRLFT